MNLKKEPLAQETISLTWKMIILLIFSVGLLVLIYGLFAEDLFLALEKTATNNEEIISDDDLTTDNDDSSNDSLTNNENGADSDSSGNNSTNDDSSGNDSSGNNDFSNNSSGSSNYVCGDNICNGYETCSSCSDDCGTCECIEDWGCSSGWGSWSSWSSCVDSQQSRTRTQTCTDLNDCGTEEDKPDELETQYQSCGSQEYEEQQAYSNIKNECDPDCVTINVNQIQEFLLFKNVAKIFILDMTYDVQYQYTQTINSTGGGSVLNEERYAPPAMTFVDEGSGVLRYYGGPEVSGGDVQKMAIKIIQTT